MLWVPLGNSGEDAVSKLCTQLPRCWGTERGLQDMCLQDPEPGTSVKLPTAGTTPGGGCGGRGIVNHTDLLGKEIPRFTLLMIKQES